MFEMWPIILVFAGFAIFFALFLYVRGNPHSDLTALTAEEKREKVKKLGALGMDEEDKNL